MARPWPTVRKTNCRPFPLIDWGENERKQQ